jgi:hypothetical protein
VSPRLTAPVLSGHYGTAFAAPALVDDDPACRRTTRSPAPPLGAPFPRSQVFHGPELPARGVDQPPLAPAPAGRRIVHALEFSTDMNSSHAPVKRVRFIKKRLDGMALSKVLTKLNSRWHISLRHLSPLPIARLTGAHPRRRRDPVWWLDPAGSAAVGLARSPSLPTLQLRGAFLASVPCFC